MGVEQDLIIVEGIALDLRDDIVPEGVINDVLQPLLEEQGDEISILQVEQEEVIGVGKLKSRLS